ncbi:MAG: hypothetical protein V3U75_01370 [Methylococcaceae bacterium]
MKIDDDISYPDDGLKLIAGRVTSLAFPKSCDTGLSGGKYLSTIIEGKEILRVANDNKTITLFLGDNTIIYKLLDGEWKEWRNTNENR